VISKNQHLSKDAGFYLETSFGKIMVFDVLEAFRYEETVYEFRCSTDNQFTKRFI